MSNAKLPLLFYSMFSKSRAIVTRHARLSKAQLPFVLLVHHSLSRYDGLATKHKSLFEVFV